MAKAKVAEETQAVEKRLVSVSVPVEDADPAALLRLGRGRPRGFWAREGRWFAHLGSASTIELPSDGAGGDRFGEVWEAARTLFSCSWKDPQSEVNPPSPRLFGGFSFSDDHVAEGVWAHFPSALFVLPELEMEGGRGSGVLTLRRHHPPSPNPAQCRHELRKELTAVRNALIGPSALAEAADVCIPATRSEIDADDWGVMVETALAEVSAGNLSKVVLSRILHASFEAAVDPVDVVMNLWKDNPASHVFLFEPMPGHVLVGAAPETVATSSRGAFRATAVAGSAPQGRNPKEKGALGAELLRSEKDLREHRVCVEDMVARLGGVSQEVRAEPEPHLLVLSGIQHLETAIHSTLRPNQTVLSALGALHPTPAVCGFPRDPALALLQAEEPFQRGWYAGPVGWFDNDGDGVFVPALRSGVGQGKEWTLFAGAGIVAGSDPSKEWNETRMKFQPVLRALSNARPEASERDEEDPGS
jgi:menaquinone-specific isochorismate synthase